MNFILKYSKTAAFVAGAFSILGFAPRYWVVADFVCFSLLLYLLITAGGAKKAFAIGYSFGFSHFAFGLSWVGNALLIEPEKFGWLYPAALSAAGAFFGLFIALPAALSQFSVRPWQRWLSFSAWLVVFEWIRSFLFTGFPWNLAGYTLAFDDYLIQAAALGGVYWLSLWALLSYSVLGIVPAEKNKIAATITAVLFIVVTSAAFFIGGWLRLSSAENTETDTVVRIVQPSIPQQMKWNRDIMEENFQTYISMSAVKNEEKAPDLIVWGETASPFRLDVDEDHRKDILPILSDGGYLITGMVSYAASDDGYIPYNSLVAFNAAGDAVAYYHKSHLVPFGEYIPLRQYLPDFIQPVANAIGTFGRGNGPERIKLEGIPAFGGIICYEAIFPHEVINQEQRPDFLINLTNDGWYGMSAGPYQHWAATRLRAVEEGVSVVRAANNGISGVVTAFGQVKAMLPLNYAGVLDVKLDVPLSGTTFYSRFGNRVSLTFCLLLLFLGGIKVVKRDILS